MAKVFKTYTSPALRFLGISPQVNTKAVQTESCSRENTLAGRSQNVKIMLISGRLKNYIVWVVFVCLFCFWYFLGFLLEICTASRNKKISEEAEGKQQSSAAETREVKPRPSPAASVTDHSVTTPNTTLTIVVFPAAGGPNTTIFGTVE